MIRTVDVEDTSSIPATNGRHRRFAAPTPPDRDPHPQVRHNHSFTGPCPKCDPKNYPRRARHRAAGQAVSA